MMIVMKPGASPEEVQTVLELERAASVDRVLPILKPYKLASSQIKNAMDARDLEPVLQQMTHLLPADEFGEFVERVTAAAAVGAKALRADQLTCGRLR